jgi:hypothetical protein
MPIFTRKADGITARSPETKRESLSVRPSCSHEDVQAVHQIVEAIALHEYLAVNLLLDDSISESPNYCFWRKPAVRRALRLRKPQMRFTIDL